MARPNEVPEERNRWGGGEDRCPTGTGGESKPVSWLSCIRAMPRARLHVCLCKDGRDLELATGEIGASGAFSAGLPSGT